MRSQSAPQALPAAPSATLPPTGSPSDQDRPLPRSRPTGVPACRRPRLPPSRRDRAPVLGTRPHQGSASRTVLRPLRSGIIELALGAACTESCRPLRGVLRLLQHEPADDPGRPETCESAPPPAPSSRHRGGARTRRPRLSPVRLALSGLQQDPYRAAIKILLRAG